MPHDLNGKPLRQGDEVIVRCRVQNIYEQAELCNVTLETLVAMPGPGGRPSILTLNAGQVEKTGPSALSLGGDPGAPGDEDFGGAPPKSVSA